MDDAILHVEVTVGNIAHTYIELPSGSLSLR